MRSEVEERGGAFRSADCDEAVNAAFRTRDAVIRRRKDGERCGFSFRSIRDIRQRIAVQKLSGAFVARNFDLAEAMPDEAWGKLTTIVLERGQWFICAQKHITTVGQDEIQVCQVQFKTDPGFAFKIDPPFPGCLVSSDIGRRAGDGGNWPQASPLRAQASPTRISTPQ